MPDIRIITRVAFSGKWAELWFEDGKKDPALFDACCKRYMLWDIVDEAGNYDYIACFGLVGWAVQWPKGSHWPLRMLPAIGIQHSYLANLSALPNE